jgi:hypothetical protein
MASPPLRAPVDDRQQRRQREHDGPKPPRLQRRSLLASGHARARQEVASRLGVPRNPSGRRLALYAAQGLDALLAPSVPAGTPVSRAPASSRRSAARQGSPRMTPRARGWPSPITCRSTTRHAPRSGAPASARSSRRRVPVTPPKPEAMPAFQAPCQPHRPHALPPATRRPIRVVSQAESRLGVLPGRRRRLTAHGVQPLGAVQHVWAWGSVSGAAAPATGERFCLGRPDLNAAGSQICVAAVAAAFPDSRPLLPLGHRGAHPAPRLRLPAHVRLGRLPPYGPELNPSARVRRALNAALAWLPCPTLEVQQADIAHLLRGDQTVTLQALTG